MTITQKIDALTAELKAYFETRVELTKLQALEKSTSVGARLAALFLILCVAMVALLFVSTWAALYLSAVFGNPYHGFGAVALFYVVVVALMVAFRKKGIEYPLRDALVRGALHDESDESKEPSEP